MERAITAPNGHYARSASAMEVPSGGSPYFGWLDDDGQPNTIKLDSVVAVFPDPNRYGQQSVALSNSAVMRMTAEANQRLLKRLGWTEGKMVQKVSA